MSETQTTLELSESRKTGAIAAQAAADAAERRSPGWMDAAFGAFVAYARIMPTRKFTTEDVRLAALSVPPPPDGRAWGAVAIRAKREKIDVCAGYALVQRGCPKTLWQLNPSNHL